jgi:hypothetical protein
MAVNFYNLVGDMSGQQGGATLVYTPVGQTADGWSINGDLHAGDTYIVQVNSADHGSGALADPDASIFDDLQSFVLFDPTGDSGVGNNAQIEVTMPFTGHYNLGVYSQLGTDGGGYEVKLFAKELLTDGGATVQDFDALNEGAWANYVSEYNTPVIANHGLDSLLRQTLTLDDGQASIWQWDNNNTGEWKFVSEQHNAAGAITQQAQYNDDGSYALRTMDTDGAAFSFRDDHYNSAGQMDIQTTWNDDGSYRQTTFDTTGTDWTMMVNDYDTGHQLAHSQLLMDDGTWQVFG